MTTEFNIGWKKSGQEITRNKTEIQREESGNGKCFCFLCFYPHFSLIFFCLTDYIFVDKFSQQINCFVLHK